LTPALQAAAIHYFLPIHFSAFVSGILRHLTLALLLCALPFALCAQTNFIPLERGDYEEREEKLMFSPGVELSGDYRFRMATLQGSNYPESLPGRNTPEETAMDHDLRLRLKSTVHRTSILNLELATGQSPWHNANLRRNRSTWAQGADGQEASVSARQVYLDLRFSPRNTLRIGKQEVTIGDRRGKVFDGVLTGISQPKCSAGTWCYQLGGMRMASAGGDWLYYLSLDYPFFYEVDANGRPLNILRVELFRIQYTEHDIPVGLNNVPRSLPDNMTVPGSWTASNRWSGYSVWDKSSGDYTPLFYHAHGQEYFGLRLLWETPNLEVYLDLVNNFGNRRYYKYNQRKTLTQHKVAGRAGELELTYRDEIHATTLVYLYASGDKDLGDTQANYARSLDGYFEIMPGSYRGTQFYFNGGSTHLNSGTGLGHSVNNISMIGLRYRYNIPEEDFVYRFGLYQLRRNLAVTDAKGQSTKDIGMEWDNTFSFKLTPHVQAHVDLNLFLAGRAFAYDDHSTPPGLSKMIVHAAGRVLYRF